MVKHIVFVLGLFFLLHSNGYAQFYNGHQQSFGKNRVQHAPFYWRYHPYDWGTVYFTKSGDSIARFVGKQVPKVEKLLASQMDFYSSLPWRIIIFNRHSDFLQRNSDLTTGTKETNTGGNTHIAQGKIPIYYTGSYQSFYRQLHTAMAKELLQQFLYGEDPGKQIASQTVLELPPWFIPGASRHLAYNDIINKSLLTDYFQRHKKAPLWPKERIYQPTVSQSIFNYLHATYGHDKVRDFIYFTRLYKNPEKALLATTGTDFKELKEKWAAYYREVPLKTPEALIKSKKKQTFYHATFSPNGNSIAYISELHGRKKVILYNLDKKKKTTLWTGGFRTFQETDKSHPNLAWFPDGRTLTFITEEEGILVLYFYDLQEKELRKRNFPYFDKINRYRFAPSGTKMVLSAIKNGQTDIFEFSLSSNSSKQITQDYADDIDPIYIQEDKILFSSNRNKDSLHLKKDYHSFHNALNIYQFTLGDTLVERMTYEPKQNQHGLTASMNDLWFLEDSQNKQTLTLARTDSTILAIDTTIHYRYLLKPAPLKELIGGASGITSARNYPLLTYRYQANQRNYISTPIQADQITDSLVFRAPYFARTKKNLSPQKKQKNISDTIIDIDHYVFEIEKNSFKEKYPKRYLHYTKSLNTPSPEKYRIYNETFFIQKISSQVDFSYLQQTYQPYTGGAVYSNPGISGFFKIGAYDLFEDYKITLGLKFSADFTANEYIVSFENLKKRWDKHFTFYRQALKKQLQEGELRTHTNQLNLDLTYPFNEIQRVTFTLSGRNDRLVPLATDRQSLILEETTRWWGHLKTTWVYDNTIKLTDNIYQGLRAKIFLETHQQLNNLGQSLYVTGFDFRHYFPIHKELIFASRLAYSSSWGNKKLIYYMGGVDNWINLDSSTPTFIPVDEIPLATDKSYAFQAVATNMRGFSQNIRNGSSFAVANFELRWPLFRYFISRPINSSVINHFQWVGFFDIGSAWSGVHPFNSNNAYDTRETTRGPITVRVDTEREPWVAGYGTGIRTKLLGYFMRFDYAWGLENSEIMPGIFYFSLSLDF